MMNSYIFTYIICFIFILYVYIKILNQKYKIHNKKIVVVGGGLSGIVITLILARHGYNIQLYDKNNDLGGNSKKASSGINGYCDKLYKDMGGIDYFNKKFINDIYNSTKKEYFSKYTKKLINTLVNNNKKAINWLEKNNIIFDDLQILGGHKYKRTLSNKNEASIGYYIINNLKNKINKYNNIYHNNTSIYNVENINGEYILHAKNVVNNKKIKINCDYLIIATGGFSYNIKKYINDDYITSLPTSNGDFAIGDGIELGKKLNANIIDIKNIQIHPTGFIDSNNINNKSKILAPEFLRGIGGILINPLNKKRFCNELGKRDYIANKMKIQKINFFILLIPYQAYIDNKYKIDFYINKKLLYVYNLNNSNDMLYKTVKKYNYYSVVGEDKFNKKIFPNTPFNNKFIIGYITPIIHYCMGGIQINENAQAIGVNGKIIRNLYAIGEVAGGLHGSNRLGGNSLLECVVFGMIAANNINKNMHKN
jgi:FAD-dependent fumarate reductase